MTRKRTGKLVACFLMVFCLSMSALLSTYAQPVGNAQPPADAVYLDDAVAAVDAPEFTDLAPVVVAPAPVVRRGNPYTFTFDVPDSSRPSFGANVTIDWLDDGSPALGITVSREFTDPVTGEITTFINYTDVPGGLVLLTQITDLRTGVTQEFWGPQYEFVREFILDDATLDYLKARDGVYCTTDSSILANFDCCYWAGCFPRSLTYTSRRIWLRQNLQFTPPLFVPERFFRIMPCIGSGIAYSATWEGSFRQVSAETTIEQFKGQWVRNWDVTYGGTIPLVSMTP
jgi:hypothetical protein